MNILGLKGPRRMTVVLPGMDSNGKRNMRAGMLLLEDFKAAQTTVLALENKMPQWNEG